MSHAVMLIDDSEDDRDLYQEYLSTDGHLDVTAISPILHPQLEDYGGIITDRYEAVILDSKMNVEAGVPFTGTELAAYLRQLDPVLPIFILSNYADDAEASDSEGASESIINKKTLDSAESARKYVARILRAIGKYEDARTEAQARIDYLIERKIGGTITAAEDTELNHWRARLTAASAPATMASLDKAKAMRTMEDKLNKLLERLAKLEKA